MSTSPVVVNIADDSTEPPFTPRCLSLPPKYQHPALDLSAEPAPPPASLPGNILLPADTTLASHLRTLLHPALLSGSLHRHLWLAGEPHNTRSLHDPQPRRLVRTTDINLHLVSSGRTLFLTPLPDFLLSHPFWTAAITPDPVLDAAARGLLRSWCLLVPCEESFRVARKHRLLPRCVRTWEEWARLVWTVQRGRALATDRIDRRYEYGELELGKLDLLRMFLVDGLWYDAADVDGTRRYQVIFGRGLSWVGLLLLLLYAAVAAYAVVVFTGAVWERGVRFGARWWEAYELVLDVRHVFWGRDAVQISYFAGSMVFQTIHATAGLVVSSRIR